MGKEKKWKRKEFNLNLELKYEGKYLKDKRLEQYFNTFEYY